MKQARPAQGAAVLLLAPIAFAGAALWTQRRAQSEAQAGPFALVVDQVQRQEATPRDVAEGFDSRFVVTLGHIGARPAAWGEMWTNFNHGDARWMTRSGVKWTLWGAAQDGKRRATRSLLYDVGSNTYKLSIATRLADVPANMGAVCLGLDNFQADETVGRKEEPSTLSIPIIPASSLAFTLRQAGEKIVAPQSVRRSNLLSVQNVSVSRVGGQPNRYQVQAIFNMPPHEGDEVFTLSSVEPSYFEDESGKRYPNAFKGGTAHDSTWLSWWPLVEGQPLKARKLTFHGRVSLNERWPLNFSAVLWDRTAQKPRK